MTKIYKGGKTNFRFDQVKKHIFVVVVVIRNIIINI